MPKKQSSIETLIKAERSRQGLYKPEILVWKKSADRKRIQQLLARGDIFSVVEEFAEQERELYYVEHPSKMSLGDIYSKKNTFKIQFDAGVWVYYPWRGVLVHTLDKKQFQKLRQSRNFNLILPSEQAVLRKLTVGVAGLNVGNPGAVCAALEMIGARYKFADIDALSVSNLNRFRAGLPDLGVNKATLTARQVYEIDPFVNVTVFENGIQKDTIKKFLLQPRLDVLVEEMDNLPLKILIRRAAQAARIPVVMVTGDGPHVVIDVERYDIEPNTKLLNGHLPNSVQQRIASFDPKHNTVHDRVVLARDFMGAKILSERLQKSFAEFGKTLVSIPQLAESSFLRGALIGFVVRQLFTASTPLRSGRYHIHLADMKLSKKL